MNYLNVLEENASYIINILVSVIEPYNALNNATVELYILKIIIYIYIYNHNYTY